MSCSLLVPILQLLFLRFCQGRAVTGNIRRHGKPRSKYVPWLNGSLKDDGREDAAVPMQHHQISPKVDKRHNPRNDRNMSLQEGEDKHESAHVHTAPWSYADTEGWLKDFPDCSGSKQSPIDLPADAPRPKTYQPMPFSFTAPVEHPTMTNNGHSIQVNGNFGTIDFPDGKYVVKQFHFHFPSEHTVDGRRFLGEMHIMTQKEGSKGVDAVLVLAILLHNGHSAKKGGIYETMGNDKETAAFFESIGFGSVDNLVKEGEEVSMHGKISLKPVAKELMSADYFHYFGSLTTPPCSETVHWYVYRRTAYMPKHMMDNFHQVIKSDVNRPVMDANGRDIARGAIAVSGEVWSSVEA